MLYQVELLTRNKIEHQSRIIAKKSKPVQIEARQLWLSRVQVSSIVPTCDFFSSRVYSCDILQKYK